MLTNAYLICLIVVHQKHFLDTFTLVSLVLLITGLLQEVGNGLIERMVCGPYIRQGLKPTDVVFSFQRREFGTSKLSHKYQITVPKEVRDRLSQGWRHSRLLR